MRTVKEERRTRSDAFVRVREARVLVLELGDPVVHGRNDAAARPRPVFALETLEIALERASSASSITVA